MPEELRAGDAPLAPRGVAVAIRVIASSRRCAANRPLRRSTTPPGVLSAQRFASHSSGIELSSGSDRAIRSTAAIEAALASRRLNGGDFDISAAAQHISRARCMTYRRWSAFHRVPVQASHLPHGAQ